MVIDWFLYLLLHIYHQETVLENGDNVIVHICVCFQEWHDRWFKFLGHQASTCVDCGTTFFVMSLLKSNMVENLKLHNLRIFWTYMTTLSYLLIIISFQQLIILHRNKYLILKWSAFFFSSHIHVYLFIKHAAIYNHYGHLIMLVSYNYIKFIWKN